MLVGNKARRLLFSLDRQNFYMSEDSLTVKYTEYGLINYRILIQDELKNSKAYILFESHIGLQSLNNIDIR